MLPRRIVLKPSIKQFDNKFESCPKGTLLFGGHVNWRRKILQANPHIKGVDVTQHFDYRVINKNVPMIIINTKSIGHAICERIRKYAKNTSITISYI